MTDKRDAVVEAVRRACDAADDAGALDETREALAALDSPLPSGGKLDNLYGLALQSTRPDKHTHALSMIYAQALRLAADAVAGGIPGHHTVVAKLRGWADEMEERTG